MSLNYKQTYVMHDYSDPENKVTVIVLAPRTIDYDGIRYLQVKFPAVIPGHGGHSIRNPIILEDNEDGSVRVESDEGGEYLFQLLTVDLLKRYFPDDAADPEILTPATTDSWLRWWYYQNFVDEESWPEHLEV